MFGMFVCGVRENVRQWLLKKYKLTIQHIMGICRPSEAYEHQVNLMARTGKLQEGQLNAIKGENGARQHIMTM